MLSRRAVRRAQGARTSLPKRSVKIARGQVARRSGFVVLRAADPQAVSNSGYGPARRPPRNQDNNWICPCGARL